MPDVPHRDWAGQKTRSPDTSWPPRVVPGVGSRSASPVPSRGPEIIAKHFTGWWKILGVIGMAMGAGWGGHAATAKYLTVDSLKPMQDQLTSIARDIDAIKTTQADQRVDIATIKTTLRLMPTDTIATRPR